MRKVTRFDSMRPFLILGLFLVPPTGSALWATDGPAPGIQLFESGRFQEARTFFAAFVAKNPQSAPAAFYLGRALFELKHYEDSAKALEKAVELAPNNSEYHDHLGRAYGLAAEEANVLRQAGLARKCRAEFEKAIELNPNNLDAREGLAEYYLEAPALLGGSVDAAKAQAAEIKKRDPARGHEVLIGVYVAREEYGLAVQETQAAEGGVPRATRRCSLGATG